MNILVYNNFSVAWVVWPLQDKIGRVHGVREWRPNHTRMTHGTVRYVGAFEEPAPLTIEFVKEIWYIASQNRYFVWKNFLNTFYPLPQTPPGDQVLSVARRLLHGASRCCRASPPLVSGVRQLPHHREVVPPHRSLPQRTRGHRRPHPPPPLPKRHVRKTEPKAGQGSHRPHGIPRTLRP